MESSEDIEKLKMEKSRAKAFFTRTKNKVVRRLASELSQSEMDDISNKLDEAVDRVIDVMSRLAYYYTEKNDNEMLKTVGEEMSVIEQDYAKVSSDLSVFFQGSYRSRSGSASSLQTVDETGRVDEQNISAVDQVINEQVSLKPSNDIKVNSGSQLGTDMWKQLKRVAIPVFDGNKRTYPSWKAAFMACVDQAPATPEYKLLQLRQYLKGEALKCIEDLGHSAEAYEAAKERLERKFGGERRQISRFLDDLDNFHPLKSENAKEIERFADLLDIAVITLKEFNRLEDLTDGSLYRRLLKKLPQSMLTRYNRWLYEFKEAESVISLRKWIIQESEFATAAVETIQGLVIEKRDDGKKGKEKQSDRSHFTSDSSATTKEKKMQCKFCNEQHGIWACEHYKQLGMKDRWDKAKELQLCYRCLGYNHLGKKCERSRSCGINGCSKTHHRLLHSEVLKDNDQSEKPEEVPCSKYTHVSNDSKKKFIGLRTVPVYVSYGNRKLQVNALLDDGSTQTYLNTSVATELGIPLNKETYNVTVNVLNGRQDFQTVPVTFGLESLNGTVKMNLCANTINSVTGSLQALELNNLANKWTHLKGIKFPCINKNGVDLLIGLDYSDLHQSLHEVRGKQGEPVARLTPLGWTCVGNLSSVEYAGNSNFHTYFQKSNTDLNQTLKRFWEIESELDGKMSESTVDRQLIRKTEESVTYQNDRYEVPLPWKESKTELPDNYDMALQRLQNTEKRLAKDGNVASAYQQTMNHYIDQGYVSEVTNDNQLRWYLPHFPVIRLDKATTKVRAVFDASAKFDGISLNDVIHQGPKLQQDLFHVLLRFRRNTVALVCDIQEMYLQVGIPPPDRRFLSFL